MQEITMTNEFGKDTFTFEANGTTYTVIAEDDGAFCVFSQRNSLTSTSIKMYNNVEELAQRSKAFKNLAALIVDKEYRA